MSSALRNGALLLTALCAIGGAAQAAAGLALRGGTESYLEVPMPPGIHVQTTELDGPVFTTADGHTLYVWKQKELRNGYAGDPKGSASNCGNTPEVTNAGLMSPYPPGLILPDASQRAACAQRWPPLLAPAGAKPVGKWTLIPRQDGAQQWAWDGQPVYTSVLDHRAGDVLGGSSRPSGGDSPVLRQPIGPPPDVPPGLAVHTINRGRMLTTVEGSWAVYYSEADTSGRSNCDAQCARTWEPVMAPQSVHPHGDWSVVERSPGVFQWAFRGAPLYSYAPEHRPRGQSGNDVPGWHNVFTQEAPPPPGGFTRQDTTAGEVLADARGRTIYTFRCGDDAADQLSCDYPDTTQAYRLAMCGGGDPMSCQKNFPYVTAAPGVKGTSRSWSVVLIDPATGHFAAEGTAQALRVWAYRGRPVYTYAGDERPGDINADSHGEFRGQRDGYKAFWLRDDFFGQDAD
jgi:predicted lipoprotein with Yx(FWY)xxD motif